MRWKYIINVDLLYHDFTGNIPKKRKRKKGVLPNYVEILKPLSGSLLNNHWPLFFQRINTYFFRQKMHYILLYTLDDGHPRSLTARPEKGFLEDDPFLLGR